MIFIEKCRIAGNLVIRLFYMYYACTFAGILVTTQPDGYCWRWVAHLMQKKAASRYWEAAQIACCGLIYIQQFNDDA